MPAPGRIDLAPGAWVPSGDLQWAACRAGGPGGQHVNTTSSAVELRIDPAAIRGLGIRALARLLTVASAHRLADGTLCWRADGHRSQARNRADCLDRLSAVVAEALPEPMVRRPTRPSRASRQRRLDAKARTARVKAMRRHRDDP